MTAGILLLAAGRAVRFGSDKRCARLPGGKTVLETSLDVLRESDLPAIVCLAPGDDEAAQAVERKGFNAVICEAASLGMAHTLAEGVTHLPPWHGVLVALADMPFVRAETYRQLACAVTPDAICRPQFNGRSGHPVAFGERFYSQLRALKGEEGARGIVRGNAAKLVVLECEDPGIHRDIDTPDDLITPCNASGTE